MPKVSPVETCLRAEAEMIKSMGQVQFGYHGLADFVLKNGSNMPAPERRLPKGIRRGKMGRCYENAGRLAAFDRYIYCEGYAFGFFPVLHGWLLDPETMQVIDPTWQGRRGLHSVCYYGIAFKTDYLRTQIIENEHWGLIDLPVERFPLLSTDPKEWRHPVMDKFYERKSNSTIHT